MADIEQVLIPQAGPAQWGQTSERIDMRIEGGVVLPDQAIANTKSANVFSLTPNVKQNGFNEPSPWETTYFDVFPADIDGDELTDATERANGTGVNGISRAISVTVDTNLPLVNFIEPTASLLIGGGVSDFFSATSAPTPQWRSRSTTPRRSSLSRWPITPSFPDRPDRRSSFRSTAR